MKKLVALLLIFVFCFSFVSGAFASESELPFLDVSVGQWYYNDIKSAYESGLINGKSATVFEPEANMTYAEAVKLAACMNQLYHEGHVSLTNGSPWYQTYVEYCYGTGIIDRDYDWNSHCTRAEYMEIFAHALPGIALQPINYVADDSIPDVKMTHPQAESIYKLYRAGILQGGDSSHICKPADNIRRCEVAAILSRMMDVTKRIIFSIGDQSEYLGIFRQPISALAEEGDKVAYTVVAVGGKPSYSYQWYYKCSDLLGYKAMAPGMDGFTGVNSACLMVDVSLDMLYKNYSFRCVVSDANGDSVTSDVAWLERIETEPEVKPLEIISQPQDVEGKAGTTASFGVVASGGTEPYSYQWQYSEDDAVFYDLGPANVTSGWVLGYSTATLVVNVEDYDLEKCWAFRCVVTDAQGQTVTSDFANILYEEPFVVTMQPVNTLAYEGETVQFVLAANGGTEPYTYRWQAAWGGEDAAFVDLNASHSWVSGYDTDALSLVASIREESYSYRYRCVITDAEGRQITSNTVHIILQPVLMISSQPQSVECASGETMSFTVGVSGGAAPYTYTWQYMTREMNDFADVPSYWGNLSGVGTESIELYVGSGHFAGDYRFRCVVTDAYGVQLTSDTAWVKSRPPQIVSQPADANVADGDYAIFRVEVGGGTGPYTYVWQYSFNGSDGFHNISEDDSWASGWNENILYIKAGQHHELMNWSFRCVVTNTYGDQTISNVVRINLT